MLPQLELVAKGHDERFKLVVKVAELLMTHPHAGLKIVWVIDNVADFASAVSTSVQICFVWTSGGGFGCSGNCSLS